MNRLSDVIRPICASFRFLLVAMLAVAVLAAPATSPGACVHPCPGANEVPAALAASADKCCARVAARLERTPAPADADHQDSDCDQCTAACCRPPTMNEQRADLIPGDSVAATLEPMLTAIRDFGSQTPIFHPPRA
jgi:hypothetical protein